MADLQRGEGMTPHNFAERMRATVEATKGEPEVLNHLVGLLTLEALATNGFHEGLKILAEAAEANG